MADYLLDDERDRWILQSFGIQAALVQPVLAAEDDGTELAWASWIVMAPHPPDEPCDAECARGRRPLFWVMPMRFEQEDAIANVQAVLHAIVAALRENYPQLREDFAPPEERRQPTTAERLEAAERAKDEFVSRIRVANEGRKGTCG